MLPETMNSKWIRFWMRRAGRHRMGRLSMWLASWYAPAYKGSLYMASLSPAGYISPKAGICHSDVRFGAYVYMGDGADIFQSDGGGPVELQDRARVYGYNVLETGKGGYIRVGPDSRLQRGSQFYAYLQPIIIGRDVGIGPNCGFYSYNHTMEPGTPINSQPLVSKGPIVVGDHAWIGYGSVVLSGVRIGHGAVVGAGSVVTRDVPDGAIAMGKPARIVKMRSELVTSTASEEKHPAETLPSA